MTRWPVYIFLLLTCLYFYCLLYPYYMVSLVPHHVLYISIVLVLLLYILLPPSFYHSLGRFLTTLGLRAQIGDPRTVVSESALESHRRFLIETLHRYLYDLLLLSYLSLFFLSVMITRLFLQVFLYLFSAGTPITMRWFPVLRLNVRVRLFSPRVCTSP